METFGGILILVGIVMAWSGFSMKTKQKRYEKALQHGVLLPVPLEYGYHQMFRAFWWIPFFAGWIIAYIWR